ncbi:MAG TPA: TPM domain-containing protein [Thermoanaerobaculia bacterium]|nr:TPM domain-containing protein [Thermoanaerobaculia bacterium]
MASRCYRLLAALTVVVSLVPALSAVEIEEVTPPPTGSWVVDQVNLLDPAQLGALDELGDRLKVERGAELAVVVVGTVGAREPRDFAVSLFNRWGVGDGRWDNGLLIFVALEDRAAEIVLGDGVAGGVEQRRSEEVMRHVMLPHFRAGKPGRAIVEGARACAERILGLGSASPLPEAQPTPVPIPAAVAQPLAPTRRGLSSTAVLTLSALWLAFVLGGLALLIIRPKRPPKCPVCKLEMQLLDEGVDDKHLTAAEQAEEAVGSTNHLVFFCEPCGLSVKRQRRKLFSPYLVCAKCGARTFGREETTVTAATYQQGGRVRVVEHCAFCHDERTFEYETRPLEREDRHRSWADDSSRSSSYSGSGSSSSSSSSSSGGSSSSSSGGSSSSYGGGRSSGGGASGRW